MKSLKILLLGSLVAVIALGATYTAFNRGWISQQALAQFNIPQLPYMEEYFVGGSDQVKILAERAVAVSSTSGEVLGSFIQVNHSQDKPLTDKAFEYGRYLYCQQVVKEYDEQAKPIASPTN